MISSALKTPEQDNISMQHAYLKNIGKILFFEREREILTITSCMALGIHIVG